MKTKYTYIICLIISALALGSCSDDPQPTANSGEEVATKITIEAGIVDVGNQSRAAEIKHFSDGQEFGMFIYEHGTNDRFAPNTANIRVAYNRKVGSEYLPRFYYNRNSYSSEDLFLVNNPKYPKNADFFGYYPVDASVSDLSRIIYPTNTNVMVAEENTDPAVNTDIDVSSGGVRIIKFHFVHLTAQFKFGFRFAGGKKEGNWQNIRRLTFVQTNPAIALYTNLEFNAIEGTITPSTSGNLSIDPKFKIDKFVGDKDADDNDDYSVYTTYNLPYDLSALADDDIVFDVEFSLGDQLVKVYTLHVTKAMLRHSDGTYGIRPGFTYNFNMTMENYLHVDQVFVDRQWITEEEELKIKI